MTGEDHPSSPDCEGPLHPKAKEGFRLFNLGQYWKAHEALEAAWLEERGEVRNLYRGILQVGVAYWHVQRGNYRGAVKVLLRSRRWLAPFPAICRGIAVAQLRQDVEDALKELTRLGPGGMKAFDPVMLKPLTWSEGEDA